MYNAKIAVHTGIFEKSSISTTLLCEMKFKNCANMITNLSLFTEKTFVKGKTFIFIDEIQEFKEITTKVKFWVDEGSFRYIFSGSLLGIALKNIKSAPVGYLKTLTMYPMDFEEFLQIYYFTDELKASLYNSFIDRKPVNEVVHNRMMQIFNTYLNVGGMPAAVEKFNKTKNLEDAISEHEDIVTQYKKDFTKYETEEKNIYLTRIYDLIPAELNKANKRFIFANFDILSLCKICDGIPTDDIHQLISLYQSKNIIDILKLKERINYDCIRFLEKSGCTLSNKSYSVAVQKGIAYIAQNLSASLKVTDICKNIFISKGTLNSAFRTELGKSVGEYIDDTVMEKSKILLSTSSALISEISDSLGFCDQFYFSRKFKDKYGETPSEYRKNNSTAGLQGFMCSGK